MYIPKYLLQFWLSQNQTKLIMSKLFVYGVHSSCPKDLLEEEFGRCGNVTDVYITQKGFAFVTMADQDGVDSAISKLNGTELDGQEIKVEQA